MAWLFAACQKPEVEEPVPEPKPGIPSIVIAQDVPPVSWEGGLVSISYEIVNPAKGGQVSAVSSEDWAGKFSYDTLGLVDVTVAENETSDTRSTVVTLTYTYGDGQEVTDDVEIAQEAFESPYDYDFELSVFTGTYFGEDLFCEGGEHHYNVWFSDQELDAEGRPVPGDICYYFDVYAPAPDDPDTPALPAGTYTMGYRGTSELRFTPDGTYAARTDGSGNEPVNITFEEGTMEILYENGDMMVEALLTDSDGKSHHVAFSGPVVFDIQIYEPNRGDLIAENLSMKCSMATAWYAAGEGTDVMQINMQFTDMDMDADGYLLAPGTLLYVNAFIPYNDYGELTPGSYPMNESEDVMTIYPTQVVDFLGNLMYLRTYANHYPDAQTMQYGVFVDGSMDVSGELGNYNIELTLMTEDGYTVSASYAGPFDITGVPGPYSTLTGDYTADLTGAVAEAYYYGDYGTGGGYWKIALSPEDGDGDGMGIEIVAEGLEFTDGIAGVYEPEAASDRPVPGKYIIGDKDSGNLTGVNYIEYESGIVVGCAPAVSGDMEITDNGDGTYTISFDFVDDRGYAWDGQWSGAVNMVDASDL